MIVVNNTAGGLRKVGIWDNLDVWSNLSVAGNSAVGGLLTAGGISTPGISAPGRLNVTSNELVHVYSKKWSLRW